MLFGAFFTAYFFIRVVGEADWFPADGKELPKRDRRRQHRDAALVELHDALGARGRAQRQPARDEDAGCSPPRCSASRSSRVQVNEYVHIGFAPHDNAQGTIFYGLTGLHGAHVFVGLTLLTFATIARLPRPLHAEGAPRRGGAGHLLALRRRHVDLRLHARSTSSRGAVLNPLRTEQEAFRFLLWVIVVVAVIVGIVLLAPRAALNADLELAERAARAAGEVLLSYYGRPPEGVGSKSSRHRPGLRRRPRGRAHDPRAARAPSAPTTGWWPRRARTARPTAGGAGSSTRSTARSTSSTASRPGRSAWRSRTPTGLAVGVVHSPIRGETFCAVRGGGALLGGERPRRCAVADATALEQALVATGFSYEPARRAAQAAAVLELLPRARDIRRAGRGGARPGLAGRRAAWTPSSSAASSPGTGPPGACWSRRRAV